MLRAFLHHPEPVPIFGPYYQEVGVQNVRFAVIRQWFTVQRDNGATRLFYHCLGAAVSHSEVGPSRG